MSSIFKLIFGIIVLIVVILIGRSIWMHKAKTLPGGDQAMNQSRTLADGQNNPAGFAAMATPTQLPSLLSTGVSDSSDQALDADLNSINEQMVASDSDQKTVDSSVNNPDSL